MPYIDVSYTVPLVARVWIPEDDNNPDDVPHVDRVVVIDECVVLDMETPVYDMEQAGSMVPVDKETAERAVEIAETYEWPSWEYGF